MQLPRRSLDKGLCHHIHGARSAFSVPEMTAWYRKVRCFLLAGILVSASVSIILRPDSDTLFVLQRRIIWCGCGTTSLFCARYSVFANWLLQRN